MPKKVKLTESAEDFLEAIYIIGKTKKVVRVKKLLRRHYIVINCFSNFSTKSWDYLRI